MEHVHIPWKGWVLVCDGRKALLFRNDGDAELLNLSAVDVLSQPDAPARDLGTDRPGRVYQSHGAARSAVEDVDRHAQAEADFLAALAVTLGKVVQENEVGSLVLVAPPRALGILRKHLPPAVTAVLKAEVAKDLVGLTTPEIERHLAA
ncbi:host attachment family protein [Xanthobacter sp. VNH20]|uniref:host attachment family protein n=1 Tax=Xanthobacter sp. VNH20 TaxID=3156616 RepID=UPI0032B4BCA4